MNPFFSASKDTVVYYGLCESSLHFSGASARKFYWGEGGGGFVKSWTSYPGKYLELSKGTTKTK